MLFRRRGRKKATHERKGRFRRLAWKLTVSHTLTVVAVFVLFELLVVLLLYGILLISTNETLTNMPASLRTLNAQLLPYVLSGDKLGLEETLASVDTLQNPATSHSTPLPRSGENALFVVDSEGIILAVSNPDAQNMVGSAFSDHLSEGNVALLRRALAGQEVARPFSASLLTPLAAASPLVASNSNSVGATFFYQTLLSPDQLYGSTFLLIAISILVFLLLATPVGAVMGAARARGLTARLKHLQTAVNAWSQGDFSARVKDDAKDELSELGQQLNSMAGELQSLVRTQQQLAMLEERQRIARDLHDSVKQQVFATTLQIGAARLHLNKDKLVSEHHLGQAEALATEARAELTRLIKALRPSELEEKPLTKALRELAKSWTKQHAMTLNTAFADIPPLSSETEQVLYRVAQEALANIAKHSGATEVDLGLEQDLDRIIMEIGDDGQGFKPGRKRDSGVGLKSMQERLEAIGGNLDVQSIPGKGTLVTAVVPLEVSP